MGGSQCAVPGCNWDRHKVKFGDKRTLFGVDRPEFGRTAEEKEHRQQLTKFLLSIRDFEKSDSIIDVLKRET